MIYQSDYLTLKDYDRDVLVYVLFFSNDELWFLEFTGTFFL